MAHRTFSDEEGVAWQVWEVRPAWAERRSEERRSEAAQPQGNERRRTERRAIAESRPALSAHLRRGWLSFESPHERRRLAPVPPGWERLTEEGLLGLLRGAQTVPQDRKRLIE